MKRDSGSPSVPIWLIADSSPSPWEKDLEIPLDPRHPTRHNIWTPILDGMQSRVFHASGRRIDTDKLYIRNAVHHAKEKPRYTARDWPPECGREIVTLRSLIEQHKPKLVLTFGAFAFEFARRVLDERPIRSTKHWGTGKLGGEFRQRVEGFSALETELLPLLHVSIARGRFLESHRYFTDMERGNYFEYVAEKLATLLLTHDRTFSIWH